MHMHVNESAHAGSVASEPAAMTTQLDELTIGVLALQGAFVEHITLLQKAAEELRRELEAEHRNASPRSDGLDNDRNPTDQVGLPISLPSITVISVRNPQDLSQCSALVLPGGESTSIALIAARTSLLTPLRDFVKIARKPVWGTCAGLILLAEVADRTKSTGQELIGGLDVRVRRNYFGRQVESFEADLDLPFLSEGRQGEESKFHSVFIRAPVVEEVLAANQKVEEGVEGPSGTVTVTAPPKKATTAEVEILARLPGRARALKDRVATAEELGEDGDIVAVRQANVFGTAFHPELTGDGRIHRWWLREVLKAARENGG